MVSLSLRREVIKPEALTPGHLKIMLCSSAALAGCYKKELHVSGIKARFRVFESLTNI